jgi:hypothetical protein
LAKALRRSPHRRQFVTQFAAATIPIALHPQCGGIRALGASGERTLRRLDLTDPGGGAVGEPLERLGQQENAVVER